jgi:dsRNA-specific ribonuclease
MLQPKQRGGGDPIGELDKLCRQLHLRPPVYTVNALDVPDQASRRLFSIHVSIYDEMFAYGLADLTEFE